MKSTRLNEYYTRCAAVFRLLTYFSVLLLVILLVFAFTVFGDEITAENFRYLVKYLDFDMPTFSKTVDGVNFGNEEDARFAVLRDDLAVVTRSGVSLYDLSGGKIYSEKIRQSNPAPISNGKYILVYDVYGNNFTLFNSFSKLMDKDTKEPILCACMSDGGFAITTKEKGYKSGVTVYNNKLTQCFKYHSKEKRITDTSLSGDARRLLCVFTDVYDGDFKTDFALFDTVEGKQISASSISGEMVIRSHVFDDGYVLLTEKGMYIYNNDSEKVFESDFGTKSIYQAFFGKDVIVTLKKDALNGNAAHIDVNDLAGELLYSADEDKIVSADVSGNTLLLLYQGRAEIITFADGTYEKRSAECPEEYNKACIADDGSFILVSDERADIANF